MVLNGIVGVCDEFHESTSTAMKLWAMSVTFASACFAPIALSPQNNPSSNQRPRDPLLFSSVDTEVRTKTALVAQHSRHKHCPGLHKITLPALALELSL